LPNPTASAINPRFPCPAIKGCRGAWIKAHFRAARFTSTIPVAAGRLACARAGFQESQMPKMKTKSGAKKRFKITGTGKVMSAQAGKRHGMIKRTTKQIRDHRGMNVRFKADGENIKKYWMPNG
jgi:large subunit ribosomal protein L35